MKIKYGPLIISQWYTFHNLTQLSVKLYTKWALIYDVPALCLATKHCTSTTTSYVTITVVISSGLCIKNVVTQARHKNHK